MLFSLKSITIFTLLLITLFKWVDSRSAPSSTTPTTTTTTQTESTTTRDTKSTESSSTSTTTDRNLEPSPSSMSSSSSSSTESKSSGRISRRSTNWNFSSSSPAANQPPISLKLIIQLIGGILFSITLLCMCCCLNFRDKRVPGYSGSGASIRGYRSDTMRRGTQQA